MEEAEGGGGPVVDGTSLFGGRLLCLQHRDGYRFSIDAVLLAHFVSPAKGDRLLDLCAGSGVISLILAYRHTTLTITALEVQPALAALARESVGHNGYDERIAVLTGDCREAGALIAAGSFDWVVANPPFYKAETGRQNPNLEEAIARHELLADIDQVAGAASFALRTRGRAAFVYPASRLAALCRALAAANLAMKRLRMVHSYPGGAARLVLVEAVKNGGEELAVLPPLFVYQEQGGAYTPEVAAWYAP
ncbi:MAG: tRNA1(Val) (adenine(37)-N6)-methyltransferase [Thermodesulfobacteriota bacterium]